MEQLKKIYNALKKYCLDTDTTCFTFNHFKDDSNFFNTVCSFDIAIRNCQEPFGKCSICILQERTDFEKLVVGFYPLKEDSDNLSKVSIKVTLPSNRYDMSDDYTLGRYFYRLIAELRYTCMIVNISA